MRAISSTSIPYKRFTSLFRLSKLSEVIGSCGFKSFFLLPANTVVYFIPCFSSNPL
ncbi:hypothetical protein [Wolbachia phage WO]|nr:hypothetical protein [Wolbachia phage WO]